MDRGVILDTFNPVICVQVLVEGDLEYGSTPLTADDGAVGKEEDPDSVPLLAVGFDYILLVFDPVLIPPVDSSGVVNAEDINVFDFKTCPFQLWIVSHVCSVFVIKMTCLADDPTKRTGSIRTREDVLVHEEAPKCVSIGCMITDVTKLYQMRSSYCHEGRIPATWKTKIPSSSRRSYTWLRN